MGYIRMKSRETQVKSVPKIEGETIETKVERMVANKEPITDGAPEIFTERADGVMHGFNVRTDRWEVATEAMDALTKSKIAKAEGGGKVVDLNPDGKPESDSGTK